MVSHRIEERSARSAAGAAAGSPAPATWPSTLGLPRAPLVQLQPPRPPRVSESPRPSPGEEGRPLVQPFGPRLFGLGILGSPARAETLGASVKGGRQQSGRRRLLRRPRGEWRPNPELARCGWVAAGPSPPRARFPPPGSRTRRDRRRLLSPFAGDPSFPPQLYSPLPTSASGTGANARLVPAAGLGEDRAGEPWALLCGSLGPGPFGSCCGTTRSCPPSRPRLLGFLNSFGAKSGFVFVHFFETSCKLF